MAVRFGQFGVIESVRVIRNFGTGCMTGFVNLCSIESALQARGSLHPPCDTRRYNRRYASRYTAVTPAARLRLAPTRTTL